MGGIFHSVNKGIYMVREDLNAPKNRYMLKDVQDSAREAGLKISFPPQVFPVNSVKAMRGCLWIAQDPQARGLFVDFVEAVFAAYFGRDEDISQDEVLAEICRKIVLDEQAFFAGSAMPDIKQQLKAYTDEAIRRGAFGSPTFFVGDDMYFGNDRLPLVRSAVLRARA